MLAAIYRQGVGFSIGQAPRPQISAREILLQVRAAAICSTDMKIIRNGHRKLDQARQIILGHECVGTVAEVGTDVRGLRLGQRVGVAPNAGCGGCRACIQGKANYCPDYTAFGIDMDGGHAQYVRVPETFLRQGNVVDLPESITDTEACLLVRNRRVDLRRMISDEFALSDLAQAYEKAGSGPAGKVVLLNPEDPR